MMMTDLASRVLELLEEDHVRVARPLTLEEVERVIERRQLRPEDALAVYQHLDEKGIIATRTGDDRESLFGGDYADDDEDVARTEGEPHDEPAEFVHPDEIPKGSGPDSRSVANLGDHELLTAEEERRLGRSVKLGLEMEEAVERGAASPSAEVDRIVARGRRARERFVSLNLRLVMKTAYPYAMHMGLDFDDLFQEGVLGLIRAVESYDHGLGYRFSTYATWWIRQAITRYIDNQGDVMRVPVHCVADVRRLRRATLVLTKAFGRPPRIRELADDLDWDPTKAKFISEVAAIRAVSTSTPVGDDGATTIGDFLGDPGPGPEDVAIESDRVDAIEQMLRSLPPRVRRIVIGRFGLDECEERTLEQLGREFGVTRERIRQIEARALKSLREQGRWRWLSTLIED